MRNLNRGGIAALVGLLFLTSAVSAKRIAIPPLPDRLAAASAVVVGKVTSIENKTIKTTPDGELGVAVVKVETGLFGAKGLTHVKVGFRPEQIKADDEVILLLSKSSVENVYVVRAFWDIIRKDAGNFAQQAEFVKRCGNLLDDPLKGLKAKDASDRLLTAALLIGKYRPWGKGAEKQEPIDAAESKLILLALAVDMDPNKPEPNSQVNAAQLFYRLGIAQTDGWMEPANFMDRNAAMKKWLTDNAEKFRIKKFVFDKSN